MKRALLEILACPRCDAGEAVLACRVFDREGEDILSGFLQCPACRTKYPIADGLASLLPGGSSSLPETPSAYEDPSLLASYMWSHFADLLGDEKASPAYSRWSHLLEPMSGYALDAGCAVGRFTFEMSTRSDFAVGVDTSRSFVQAARRLMRERRFTVALPQEGRITEKYTIVLPGTWDSRKVEFIQGDAQALPFQPGCFTSLSSLNIVDKVPLPLAHLREMNRVAKKSSAQLLFSDPFSWSEAVADAENWLGGTADGPYAGKGIENIASLLKGEKGEMDAPWQIREEGHVWWKIRKHRNLFELIRSCYIKASR
jgi:uncharacterized protein YbaR (Trm112 family)